MSVMWPAKLEHQRTIRVSARRPPILHASATPSTQVIVNPTAAPRSSHPIATSSAQFTQTLTNILMNA
jgi:hypothetical protein